MDAYIIISKLVILVLNTILFHLQMTSIIRYKMQEPPMSIALTDLISIDMIISFYMATVSTGCIHVIITLDVDLIKNLFSMPLSLSLTFWCFCSAMYMPMGITIRFLLMIQKTPNISEVMTEEAVWKRLRIFAGGVAMVFSFLCVAFSGTSEGLILYAVTQNPIANQEKDVPTAVYGLIMLTCFSMMISMALKTCLYKAKCKNNDLLGFKPADNSNDQLILYLFTTLAIIVFALVVRYIMPYEVRSIFIYVNVCMLWPPFLVLADKKLTKAFIKYLARCTLFGDN